MKKYIKMLTIKDEVVIIKVKGKDESEIEEKLNKYKYKKIISTTDEHPDNSNNYNKSSIGMDVRKNPYQRRHSRARILA